MLRSISSTGDILLTWASNEIPNERSELSMVKIRSRALAIRTWIGTKLKGGNAAHLRFTYFHLPFYLRAKPALPTMLCGLAPLSLPLPRCLSLGCIIQSEGPGHLPPVQGALHLCLPGAPSTQSSEQLEQETKAPWASTAAYLAQLNQKVPNSSLVSRGVHFSSL